MEVRRGNHLLSGECAEMDHCASAPPTGHDYTGQDTYLRDSFPVGE